MTGTLRGWWQGLASRERLALLIAALIAAGAMAWVWVWEPLAASVEAERNRVAEQRSLLAWLDAVEPLAREWAGENPEIGESDGRSLLASVDRSARGAGLAGVLERIEPARDAGVRIWFAAVEYRRVMRWLEDFSRQRPVTIERIEAEPAGEPGRIDARIVLGERA